MSTYTVFCRERTGAGTTWITAVEAGCIEHAKDRGQLLCAIEWGMNPEKIIPIGVIEGDVDVVFWEDI